MLIKTKNSLPFSASKVKKSTTACLSIIALGLSTVPMSAFAYSVPTKERVITVKFNASDVQTEAGKVEVYEMLLAKAASTCRRDLFTLKALNESIEACTADMMEQFVTSAGIESLATYHAAQTSQSTL